MPLKAWPYWGAVAALALLGASGGARTANGPLFRAARAAPATDAPADAAPGAAPRPAYSQSPYLEAQALPPVADRLPRAPLTWPGAAPGTAPPLPVGTYGGHLRVQYLSRARCHAACWLLAENWLAPRGGAPPAFHGNLAARFHAHPAQTHFRFEIRHGLRWSDGAPVTTADVAFAYEETWHHDRLNFLGMPAYLRAGGRLDGTPPQLVVQDDYAFFLIFDEAYGRLPGFLASQGPYSYADLLKPAHHLKAYHPDYAPGAQIAAQLAARGLRYPWELFAAADCYPAAAHAAACQDFPVLWPWKPAGRAGAALRLTRNPYYHKVDAHGRQLPYLDEVTVTALAAGPTRRRPGAGAFDLLWTDDLQAWAPRRAWALDAAYAAQWRAAPAAARLTLHLNRTFADAEWRALAAAPDFRRALLLAADRPALRALLLADGTPPAAPAAAFDPVQARALLDGLGLTARDAAGWRTTPSGAPLRLAIEHDADRAAFAAAARLLAARFRDVGLNAQAAAAPPSVLHARRRGNQVQMALGWAAWDRPEGGIRGLRLRHADWGPLWRLWRETQGRQGEAPPPPVQRLHDLYARQAQARAGTDEQARVADQLQALHEEQQWGLPLTEPLRQALILAPRLRNVPATGTAAAALQAGEGYFLEDAGGR